MAEVNQDLVQQLEANIRAFESAGLEEEAKSSRAKLAKLTKSATKESVVKESVVKESVKATKEDRG